MGYIHIRKADSANDALIVANAAESIGLSFVAVLPRGEGTEIWIRGGARWAESFAEQAGRLDSAIDRQREKFAAKSENIGA